MHLIRHCSEHTCASAISYEINSKTTTQQCNFIYILDLKLDHTNLDAGEQTILSNLPKLLLLVCDPDNMPFPFPYKPCT